MTATPPTEPSRLLAFARFFKNYMSVWAIVVAALPIPTTFSGFIPTYGAQTKSLSVYTSLFCFLLLGFIFYSRHGLARQFFPRPRDDQLRAARTGGLATRLPAVLIIVCVLAVAGYQEVLRRSVWDARAVTTAAAAAFAQQKTFERLAAGDSTVLQTDSIRAALAREVHALGGPDTRSAWEVLKETDLARIPHSGVLALLYITIFASAEAAFILMALKEYLQDILGITDQQLIEETWRAGSSAGTPV